MSIQKKKAIMILKKLKIVDKSSTLSQIWSDFPEGNLRNDYKPTSIEDCAEMILHLMKPPKAHTLGKSEDRVVLRHTTPRPRRDRGMFIIRTGPDEYTTHQWYESD